MHVVKGKRSVFEALKSSAEVDRILMVQQLKTRPDIMPLFQLARDKGVKIQTVTRHKFESSLGDEAEQSQGIVAYVRSKKGTDLTELVADPEKYPVVVVLDHLQDPYNFGAILRTCDLLGVKAVIYPKDRNAQLTPGVIKASSGAVHHLDLIKVVNIGQAVTSLKQAGYWICSTDVTDGTDLDEFDAPLPLALIVGNEEKGVSNRINKMADWRLYIPTIGQVSSFNVSVAAGILLYKLTQGLRKG